MIKTRTRPIREDYVDYVSDKLVDRINNKSPEVKPDVLKTLKCPSCGATINESKCSYCGSMFAIHG